MTIKISGKNQMARIDFQLTPKFGVVLFFDYNIKTCFWNLGITFAHIDQLTRLAFCVVNMGLIFNYDNVPDMVSEAPCEGCGVKHGN